MNWTFYIDGVLIDEPQGFSDIVLEINRDADWNGIFFENSTTSLKFFGNGAALLIAKKQEFGLSATATFKAELECGETVDIIETNFDFGTYYENCGNICFVRISLENTGCLMTLRNRYDQKVNLQKATSFNNSTNLQQYTGLDLDLTLAPQGIIIGNEFEMDNTVVSEILNNLPNWVQDAFGEYNGYVSPPAVLITNESFGVFTTSPLIELSENHAGAVNQPPYFLFPTATGTATIFGNLDACSLTDTVLNFRMKGTADVNINVTLNAVGLTTKIFRLPFGLDPTDPNNWIAEYSQDLFIQVGTGISVFDQAASVPLSVSQGDFIYFGFSFFCLRLFDVNNFTLTFEAETFYSLTTIALCPATETKASMVNEVGSRILESITDRCLTMKSTYFGRTDSQPYSSNSDGCGSLRILTNGLKIRVATPSNHFMSFQDYFMGLNAIDNLGIGLETNPNIPGAEWVRVEPVEYFYQNVKMITLLSIPDALSKLDPSLAYSKIKIGYDRWKTEKVNGLTEFNSNKEYRTSLTTIKNELDNTLSLLVAGGIAIEITRQQQFSVGGKADTSFDNENFIICVDRSGYGYIVEQNNITTGTNITSPTTVYNWRIRPMYNLMRWFKSIAQCYVNLSNTTSKLFFSSGEGNYIASGTLTTPDGCRLENKVLSESHDLVIADFLSTVNGTPIYLPETVEFEYPLSLADYLIIKSNPYGYIEFQCGNSIIEKGFVKNIRYKPSEGIAQFNLIKKWP